MRCPRCRASPHCRSFPDGASFARNCDVHRPRRHLAALGSAENAAAKCGMTPMAASVMWSKYQKEGFLTMGRR